jgi:hypothetical protein
LRLADRGAGLPDDMVSSDRSPVGSIAAASGGPTPAPSPRLIRPFAGRLHCGAQRLAAASWEATSSDRLTVDSSAGPRR